MTIVPVGDYRPDAPPYLGTHSTVATNVYPRPDGSMGPLKAATVMSSPLTRPANAFMARDGAGVVFLYMGQEDSRNLAIYRSGTFYQMTTSTAIGFATLYYPWRFCQFGDDVFCSHWSGGLWYHPVGSTADFTQVSGAPSGAHIATIEPGFVMLGHLNDSAGEKPSSLRWSALNDGTDFPTVGSSDAASKQSDEQDLPNGGRVMAILGGIGGAAGAVLTERSIYRMEYVGAPSVFAFREVVRGTGCAASDSAVAVNGVAYFLAEEGFCRFDGQTVVNIGQGRVNTTFWADVDRQNLHRVCVAHDPLRKIIVWAYPTTAATNGNPNKWFIYSYAADRWSFTDDTGIAVCQIFTALTAGVSLDDIGATLGVTLDNAGVSLESATLNGGAPILAGFDTQTQLVYFTGAALAALVETGETDAQGSRVFVSGIRPLCDASTVTAAVGYRTTLAAAPTYSTLTDLGPDGTCPQRIATRYARARIYIPAGATWTYLAGADVAVRAEGRR